MMWLEAALAFALVMLVFATMVTTITEMILRALNSREAHFRLMVEDLYAKVIRPQVEAKLGAIDATAFANLITTDPTYRPVGEASLISRVLKKIGITPPSWLDDLWGRFEPRNATQMNAMEFMERLGSTEVGRAIAAEGQARIEVVINDLAQKYDRFCAGTRARFAAKTQLWGVPIAIILAFALNVDAVRVFNTFLSDSKVRGAVLERQEKIEAGAKVAQEKLAATLAELEKQQQALPAQQDGAAARAELDKRMAEARKLVDDFGKQNKDLSGLGVPVGRTLYPYCDAVESGKSDGLCTENKIQPDACIAAYDKSQGIGAILPWLGQWRPSAYCSEKRGPLASWFLSTLLAGVLIGLGAPFWFDLARGLSSTLKLLRALGLGGKDGDEKKKDQAAQAGSPAQPPSNPVEAFSRAAEANPLASGRPLLTADGRIDRL